MVFGGLKVVKSLIYFYKNKCSECSHFVPSPYYTIHPIALKLWKVVMLISGKVYYRRVVGRGSGGEGLE